MPKPPNTTCPKCDQPKAKGQSYCYDHMNAYKRAWCAANRDRALGYVQAWKAAHPERTQQHIRASKARRPEHYAELARVRCARRRATLQQAFVEDVLPLVLLELDDGVCGICGGDVDPLKFEIDHVIPLVHGGDHSYANTQVAHPACNRLKGTHV